MILSGERKQVVPASGLGDRYLCSSIGGGSHKATGDHHHHHHHDHDCQQSDYFLMALNFQDIPWVNITTISPKLTLFVHQTIRAVVGEIVTIREKLTGIINHDWVSVPLVYTQVLIKVHPTSLRNHHQP